MISWVLELVRVKLGVPGNTPMDLSQERREDLERQLGARLKPVLRPADFAEFDLAKAFALVSMIWKGVG